LAWAKERTPPLDPATRLAAAIEQFFGARAELAPSSTALYRYHLRRHVIPHVGSLPIGKVNQAIKSELRAVLATEGKRTVVYVPGALKKDGSLKKPWEVARDRRRGTNSSPDGKRFSPQTLRNLVVNIKAVLGWAKERKHIPDMPKIEIPKVPRPQMEQPYSRDEAKKLIAAAPTEMRRLIYVLSYDAGCRKSELLGLQWEQINWEHHFILFDRQRYRGVLKQTKGGRERKIPMSAPLEMALKKRKLAFSTLSAFVFCQDDGAPLEEHNLRTFEERDAQAAELRKVRWHHKRHTFANLATEGGQSPWALQSLLGHRDIRTTQTYVDPMHQPMTSVLDEEQSQSSHP
jgi:integrase